MDDGTPLGPEIGRVLRGQITLAEILRLSWSLEGSGLRQEIATLPEVMLLVQGWAKVAKIELQTSDPE